MKSQPDRLLAQNLRTARRNAGMTQEQIAANMVMARTTIVAIEKGQRRVIPDELKDFAHWYGVSITALMDTTLIENDTPSIEDVRLYFWEGAGRFIVGWATSEEAFRQRIWKSACIYSPLESIDAMYIQQWHSDTIIISSEVSKLRK